MAITVTTSSVWNPDASGAQTLAFDVGGTEPDAMVFTLASGKYLDSITAVSYNGVALTKHNQGDFSTGGHQHGETWYGTGAFGTGSNNISITAATTADRIAVMHAISTSSGVVAKDPTDYSVGTTGGTTYFSMTPPDGQVSRGFEAGSQRFGTPSALSGNTMHGSRLTTFSQMAVASEDADSTGTRNVGHTGTTGLIGAAGILVYEDAVVVAADPITVNLTLPAPTITGPDNIVDHPDPLDIRLTLPEPTIIAPIPRQLPLVGEYAEVPGRVAKADGLTAPVLSEVNGVPEWVEGTSVGILNNFTAIIAPTVNDDVDLGYSVGSKWYDTVLGDMWMCLDATDGAADWSVIGYDGYDIKVQTSQASGHWLQVGEGQHATNPTFLEIGGTTNDATWGSWGGAFAVRGVDTDEAVWLQTHSDGFIIYRWDSVADSAAADDSVTLELYERGSAAATPETGGWKLYFKSDGFYVMDDAGVETGPMGSGGGSALTVTDESGTVSDTAVTSITVPDGTLVDNGVGDVTLREVPAGVIGAKIRATSAQTIATATVTEVAMDTADWDTDGLFGDANDELVIPAGMGGQWLVGGVIYWPTAAAYAQARLNINGTVVDNDFDGSANKSRAETVLTLAAGDTIDLDAYQSSGGNLDIGHASASEGQCALWAIKLGSGTVGEAIGVKAYNSAVQSISDSTNTALTFNTEEWDTDGYHSTSSNTSRFTVPAGLGGEYVINASTYANFTVSSYCYLSLHIDGSGTAQYRSEKGTAASPAMMFLSQRLHLDAGQYVEVYLVHTNGSAQNVGHASARRVQTEFSMSLVATQGGNTLKTGTTFPTGPATGDRYRRSDKDYTIYFYDGTRWLSEQLFNISYSANLSATTNTSRNALAAIPGDVFFTDMVAAYVVNGTNNGSNYWSWKGTGLLGATVYGLDDSSAVSGSTYTSQSIAVDTALASPEVQVYFTVTKTGSPGDWLGGVILQYRLIAT